MRIMKKRKRIRYKDNSDFLKNASIRTLKRHLKRQNKKVKCKRCDTLYKRKEMTFFSKDYPVCKECIKKGSEKRNKIKKSVNENYSKEDRVITLKAFGYKCYKCGSKNNLQIDHHRPLSKGFPLTLDNAVVLCGPCNRKKLAKSPEKFYGKRRCDRLDRKLKNIKKGILEEPEEPKKENKKPLVIIKKKTNGKQPDEEV